jgi:hypothetical protein
MKEEGRERKRITRSVRLPAIPDDLEFTRNKSSDNARPLCEVAVTLATNVWIDKHYHDRHSFGDDTGKREGIGPEVVESLVKKCIPHLLFYCTSVKGFHFVNQQETSELPVRIVLMEGNGAEKLNVVIQAHFIAVNKFEITVKTALRTDDFRLYQGQYAIELQGDTSILLRKDNNRIVEISNL